MGCYAVTHANKERLDDHMELLRLIQRSDDIGEGWRNVPNALWNFIQTQATKLPELVELHSTEQKIRLTDEGLIVYKWM